MHQQKIFITKTDYQRLQNLLLSDFTQAIGNKPYLSGLHAELAVAHIVESEETPADIVTMNSTVRLRDLETDELETYTLVYPQDANIKEGKLSILTPIGTAILGYRIGDQLRSRALAGGSKIRVEEILFQPERSGLTI